MGAHNSSFEQKVVWMVSHASMWKGWPTNQSYSDNQIIEAMRKDGLVSEKANNYDIMDFGKLVAEARSRMRKG